MWVMTRAIPQGYPKATPRPPQGQLQAICSGGASLCASYSLGILLVFPSYSLRVFPLFFGPLQITSAGRAQGVHAWLTARVDT